MSCAYFFALNEIEKFCYEEEEEEGSGGGGGGGGGGGREREETKNKSNDCAVSNIYIDIFLWPITFVERVMLSPCLL